MDIDILKLLDDMLAKSGSIDSVDIPNIDLYMDQVTTFMEENLKAYKRKDEDKVLTKTMINNYAKNDLLPSPDKKKYTKDHIVLMTLIYYYKNVLSINDIKTIMEPITEKHFNNNTGSSLVDIYDVLFENTDKIADSVRKDLESKMNLLDSFHIPDDCEDEGFIRNFILISMLTYDITLKKQLIEIFIDKITEEKDKAIEQEKLAKLEREKAEKQEKLEKEKAEKEKAEKEKTKKEK